MATKTFKYTDDLVVCRAGEADAPVCAGQSKVQNKRYDFFVHKTYEYEYDGSPESVPIGTPTDFASVPGVARAFLSKIGYHTEAAVVHDYLYGLQTDLPSGDLKTRADDVFWAAMKATDMKPWKAWLAYAAVAALGHGAFNSDRTQKARLQAHEFGHGLGLAAAGVVLFALLALAGVAGILVAALLPVWLLVQYVVGKILGP